MGWHLRSSRLTIMLIFVSIASRIFITQWGNILCMRPLLGYTCCIFVRAIKEKISNEIYSTNSHNKDVFIIYQQYQANKCCIYVYGPLLVYQYVDLSLYICYVIVKLSTSIPFNGATMNLDVMWYFVMSVTNYISSILDGLIYHDTINPQLDHGCEYHI